MRAARTLILTALILGVLVVLVVKKKQESTIVPAGGESPAAQSIADAKEKGMPVWVLVHSTGCIPCKEMEDTYSKLEPEFGKRVKFITIDIDDPAEQKIIADFGIRFVPTSVFIGKDGEVVKKQVGAIPIKDMKARLTEMLEK